LDKMIIIARGGGWVAPEMGQERLASLVNFFTQPALALRPHEDPPPSIAQKMIKSYADEGWPTISTT
jgi:hypothetical protein